MILCESSLLQTCQVLKKKMRFSTRFTRPGFVFCYKTVLTYCKKKIVLEKLLKFETEGREFANFLRSLEQFIQTVKGHPVFSNFLNGLT